MQAEWDYSVHVAVDSYYFEQVSSVDPVLFSF